MAVVVKDRVCRQCGMSFPGGPRAWYCPACRAERKRESCRRYKHKGRADRPLGCTDRCTVCGREYIVNSARQKYCPDCAHEAVRAVDRAQSRAWIQGNKDTYYHARNEQRRKERHCIICGVVITAKTPTITCDNPDCKRARIRQRQQAAEARRAGREPPSDYKPTK